MNFIRETRFFVLIFVELWTILRAAVVSTAMLFCSSMDGLQVLERIIMREKTQVIRCTSSVWISLMYRADNGQVGTPFKHRSRLGVDGSYTTDFLTQNSLRLQFLYRFSFLVRFGEKNALLQDINVSLSVCTQNRVWPLISNFTVKVPNPKWPLFRFL